MHVTFDPTLQKFIDDQIRVGRFGTAAEVLEAGLARLMLDPLPDHLDDVDLAAIAESERQIERGEDLDWTAVAETLRARYLSKPPHG